MQKCQSIYHWTLALWQFEVQQFIVAAENGLHWKELQDHPIPTPLPPAGTPSTGPCYSKPHPMWSWTLPSIFCTQPVPPFWDPLRYCNPHECHIFHQFTEISVQWQWWILGLDPMIFITWHRLNLNLFWSRRLRRLSGRLYTWKLCSSLITWNKSLNCRFGLCRMPEMPAQSNAHGGETGMLLSLAETKYVWKTRFRLWTPNTLVYHKQQIGNLSCALIFS